MSPLKRAIICRLRLWGQSLLLFLIFLILGTSLAGAINVRSLVAQTDEKLQRQFEAVTMLQWEHRSYGVEIDGTTTFEFPTLEMIEAVGNLPHVRHFDARGQSIMKSLTLFEARPELTFNYIPEDTDLEYLYNSNWGNRSFGQNFEQFITIGVNNIDVAELEAGLITINEGTFLTEDSINRGKKQIVISSLLAYTNQIEVGSTIELEASLYDFDRMIADGAYRGEELLILDYSDEYLLYRSVEEFVVVGTFDVNLDFSISEHLDNVLLSLRALEINLYNRIYMPFSVFYRIEEGRRYAERPYLTTSSFFGSDSLSDLNVALQPTFILNNPRDFNTFAYEARQVLPEGWFVTNLNPSFQIVATAMDDMLDSANLILYGAFIAALAICTLITIFIIKEKEKEIAIYKSLGEKKRHITAQLLMEILCIFSVSFIISFACGIFLSGRISSIFFEQELMKFHEEDPILEQLTFSPHELREYFIDFLSVDEAHEMYTDDVSFKDFFIFFSVKFTAIGSATLLTSITILRKEAKALLN